MKKGRSLSPISKHAELALLHMKENYSYLPDSFPIIITNQLV